MPLKIVRNNIVNMETDAIVNIENFIAASNRNNAIYNAAGYDELMKFKIENFGFVSDGEAFITPGFNLKAKFIIHAVSPLYINGKRNEEKKLRSCYQNVLALAKGNNIKSIAFPLISTGGFGYPKAEGLRIAVDEINAFLAKNDMLIYIVVSDENEKNYPNLEEYIEKNYIEENTQAKEFYAPELKCCCVPDEDFYESPVTWEKELFEDEPNILPEEPSSEAKEPQIIYTQTMPDFSPSKTEQPERSSHVDEAPRAQYPLLDDSFLEERPKKPALETEKVETKKHVAKLKDEKTQEPDFSKLEEIIGQLPDTQYTFSQCLMFLIKNKKLKNSDVYKRAIIDKKVFSKIKNNINYHPNKLTALCLCIGAKLNIDEAKDLLARAGYALSPCNMTDVIFTFFIKEENYDMIELDIKLEEHGLPCIIS